MYSGPPVVVAATIIATSDLVAATSVLPTATPLVATLASVPARATPHVPRLAFIAPNAIWVVKPRGRASAFGGEMGLQLQCHQCQLLQVLVTCYHPELSR